jgi:hypothetical protein
LAGVGVAVDDHGEVAHLLDHQGRPWVGERRPDRVGPVGERDDDDEERGHKQWEHWPHATRLVVPVSYVRTWRTLPCTARNTVIFIGR